MRVNETRLKRFFAWWPVEIEDTLNNNHWMWLQFVYYREQYLGFYFGNHVWQFHSWGK